MAQMNVSLPEGLKTWAETRVADGDYSSTSDYVRDLMRRDREDTEKRAHIRAALAEGMASGVSTRSLQDIYAANRAQG